MRGDCRNGRDTAVWAIAGTLALSLVVLAAQLASVLSVGFTHEYGPLYVAGVAFLAAASGLCLMRALRGDYKTGTALCSWAAFWSVMGMGAGDAARMASGDPSACSFPYAVVLLAIAIPVRAVVCGTSAALSFAVAYGVSCLAMAGVYHDLTAAAVTGLLTTVWFFSGRLFRRTYEELCIVHGDLDEMRGSMERINEALRAMNGDLRD